MRITTLALSAAMVLGGVGVAGMAQAAPEARPTVRPASPFIAARPELQMKRQQALRLEGALAHRPGAKANGEHGKMACEKGKMAKHGKGHGDKARRGKGKHGKAHAQNGKGKKAGERGRRGHDRGGGKA